MSWKTWLAGGAAATVFTLVGCGDGKKKDTTPTQMMPLPPPPVGLGAGGPPPKAADPMPDDPGDPKPTGSLPTKK